MDALTIDLAWSQHVERQRDVEERNRLDVRDVVPAGALIHTRRN